MIENQYPIGKFEYKKDPDKAEKEQLIGSLSSLPEKLRIIIGDMSEAQLDTPYREGGWTVRQVVHHLADAHLNGYLRFKWAVTEDRPVIKDYDQDLWALTDDSRKAPADISVRLLASVHQRWVNFLKTFTEETFLKSYVHPETGEMRLIRSLALYEWHGRHHVAQIRGLKQKRGW